MKSTLLAAAILSIINVMSPHSSANALSQSVVVIGLNAALQKRFILPPSQTLEPGNVHRSHKVETGVGGKGQDVGVAMSCLLDSEGGQRSKDDDEKKVLLAQFLGAGPEGDAVSHALQTSHRLSDALTIRNAAPLRTCTTIVGANGEATELVESSGKVTPGEMAALQDKVDQLAKEGGKAGCVCVMGSMPPGCTEETYADLTSRLAGSDSLVLIDSVAGLVPLLGSLKSIFDNNDVNDAGVKGGAVLKLNAAELCKLSGLVKSESDQVSIEDLTASTRGFFARYADAVGALDYLCITDGKWPGYLVEVPKPATTSDPRSDDDGSRTWRLPAVDLSNEDTLFPIGAGDTVAAGTLAAWQYLHHQNGRGGRDGSRSAFFGVVPSKVQKVISDRRDEWSEEVISGSEDEGYKMATAFAFGLSCGSASCLKQENSVFEVDDAVKFFGEMTKPVVGNIGASQVIHRDS